MAGGLHALLLVIFALTVVSIVLALGGFSSSSSSPSWLLVVLGVVLVSLAIVPLSRWLRQGLDALIYGWPDDPYGVLSQVQAELALGPSPQAIVPAAVATITATLRLPYCAIVSLPDGATFQVGAPPPNSDRLAIPLVYGETTVGRLEVAARRAQTDFSARELQLLHDLARQVGITLHAAQLSEALQASRAHLVTAREEERRRIRRDLHDGLGPTLAAIRLQLEIARRTLRSDPAAAEVLLDDVRDDVVDATGGIRRLVYDLRPPMLDEHGLAGALRGLGRLIEPTVLRLDLPETLPTLPAAVEVALYRIAAEALHNVARHAHATACTVALELGDDRVWLRVQDNGRGLRPDQRSGVGLSAMRERAGELGGDVTVESRTTPEGGSDGVVLTAWIPWSME